MRTGKPQRMVQPSKRHNFTRVILETPAAVADDAAGIFSAYGALGCEIRKAPGKPATKTYARSQLHVYFDKLNNRSLDRIQKALRAARMIDAAATPSVSRIQDPGWATMWQKRFEPFPVGERFLIVPPWAQTTATERIQIIIRPGQAFGTGHHASTFGTLHLIADTFGSTHCARVLDVGTGSGILAIAAHKLGARKVVAIDVDAVALENAIENADLNRLAGSIRFSAAPLSSIRGSFELITANILSSVLIAIAPQLKARLHLGGYLILAGILAREADAVAAAYAPELKHLTTRADGVWRALLFRR